MKCYECKWLDRSVILTSSPPQYGCTLGFGSHYADHECEYDFMPIVRCKDCKWWGGNKNTEHNNHLCNIELGRCFQLNDKIYMRVVFDEGIRVYDMGTHEYPCLDVENDTVIGINMDNWVVPIRDVEFYIND